MAFWAAIPALFSTLGGVFTKWQERKLVEAQGKVDVAQAKVDGQVKKAQTLTEGEVQMDVTATEGMGTSWKDEWFTILLSIPVIMCFVPKLQIYVKTGFEVLRDSTPEWYQWCFIGAIVASFGLRTWFNRKNGNGNGNT